MTNPQLNRHLKNQLTGETDLFRTLGEAFRPLTTEQEQELYKPNRLFDDNFETDQL